MYKRIAGHINIPVICKEFQRLGFYTGAVELALAGAEQADPSGLGIEWMKSGRLPQDSQGRSAYEKRMSCYSCALHVLEELVNPPAPKVTSPKVSPTTQLKRTTPTVSKEDRNRIKNQVLNKMISSKDELFHDALYLWHLDKGLERKLLELQTPYLEQFLLKMKDYNLLWRYYDQNEKYDKAAQILLKFAEKYVLLPT